MEEKKVKCPICGEETTEKKRCPKCAAELPQSENPPMSASNILMHILDFSMVLCAFVAFVALVLLVSNALNKESVLLPLILLIASVFNAICTKGALEALQKIELQKNQIAALSKDIADIRKNLKTINKDG